jgi:TonB family protein
MHTMLRLMACLSVTVSQLAAAAASPERPLQPLHPWNINYGDTQCTAARDFGDVSNPIVLGIVPAPDGQSYELLVSRPRSGPDFATEMPGTVDFGRGPVKAWLLYYGVKGSSSSIYQYRISVAEMNQGRSAAAVKLDASGGQDFEFSLSSMPALLDGLQRCSADLHSYWNMDGEKVGSIATPAKGDVRRVFSADDYPGEALQNGQEGQAQYTLLIDEKGNVAACHVLKPSGVPILDAMGCQVIRQRAKFKPALDRNGKAMRSTVVTPPVSWALE